MPHTRFSLLMVDNEPGRRRAVKRWLVSSPEVITTRLAEAASADVAFSVLQTRGADIVILEASMMRVEDAFPAELGRAIAELPRPPRLILYAHHYQNREIMPGITAAHFQLNAALAHGFVDLRRPDAPARLIETVQNADRQLLFLHT